MFVLPDLYVLYILEDFFTNLKNHPEALNYVLSGYHRFNKIIQKSGDNYIHDLVNYIYDNKIKFIPGFELDSESVPCISTLSYSGEEGQFIGDTGLQDLDYNELTNNNTQIEPVVYYNFDALSYDGVNLIVPAEYELNEKLWRNVFITNGSFSSQLTGMRNFVIEGGRHVTILSLKETISNELDKKNWKAQSGPQSFITSLGASHDRATVLIKLITSGDYALHRALSVVLRMALKSSRMAFENAGLQTPTFTFQMPNIFNGVDQGFESTIIMNTLITDHWIDIFTKTTDPGLGIGVDLTATSDIETKLDVEIGDE